MSDKQLLATSCCAAAFFPKNIVRSSTSKHHLEGFYKRLNEHKNRLLCEDGRASLDLWEYYDSFGGTSCETRSKNALLTALEFRNTCISNIFQLKGRLEGDELFTHEDPRSRFMYAPCSFWNCGINKFPTALSTRLIHEKGFEWAMKCSQVLLHITKLCQTF